MATTEKNTVFVELYDLTLSERADDRFGRVVTSKSLREDDLINIAVQRRTDLNPTTLRASLDILKEIAVEEVTNGASVQFGLGFFSLDVKGVFIGDHAAWDPLLHSLHIKTASSVELRQAIKHTHVKVLGRASYGTCVNAVKDVASGEENKYITPGGGINVAGVKIKIVGSDSANGIRFINQYDGTETIVPATSILVNDPGKLSFIAPATLTVGDYKLSVTTQYASSSTLLKEPRTFVFEQILAVQ